MAAWQTQQEAGFRIMGELQNRVVPLHQTVRIRSTGPWLLIMRHRPLVMSRLFSHRVEASRGVQSLGAGESVKRARASNEGRERGDGHLPSASQSNHFPDLLF